MHYECAFANSAIMPDGKIFVTGGQSYAVPCTDTNSVMNPELWDSATHTVNMDQRRIALTASATNGTTYKLDAPSDPGVVLLGY